MKAALLLILLVSICLLHAGADDTDIPVFPDFDFRKIAGTWYSIAYFTKETDPVDVISIDAVMEPSDEGDLDLSMRYITDGTCKTSNVYMVHTDKPGIFTIPSVNEVVHIADTDYESYHFLLQIMLNYSYAMFLLSRTREASDEVKTKFRTLAGTLGFDVDQMVNTRLAESCP